MKSRRARSEGAALLALLKVAGWFIGVALMLFLHVWWPIQAERNLVQLRRVETQVFQRKSELTALNDRYARLTSLTNLDQWAKQHGPWKQPGANDVVAIPD